MSAQASLNGPALKITISRAYRGIGTCLACKSFVHRRSSLGNPPTTSKVVRPVRPIHQGAKP